MKLSQIPTPLSQVVHSVFCVFNILTTIVCRSIVSLTTYGNIKNSVGH